MHSLVTFYHSIPSSTWTVLGAALGLSGLLQAAKHYFFSKLSDKAVMSLTTLTAFLASTLQYEVGNVKANPTVLGSHTAALLGAMTLAYRYVVAPGYQLLLDAKTYRSNNVAINNAAPVTATPASENAF